jgi:hypothetical protein
MYRMSPVPLARYRARRILALCAACCLFVYAAATHAARTVRVYEAAIARASSPAAVQDAMRQVLVRATGRRDAGSDPALATIVANASTYVKEIRPNPAGGSEVIFDSNAIEQAVGAAGRNIWEPERPFTLVVLHPPLAVSAADDARRELERVAAARGLPVSLVPISLVDSSGVELDRNGILQSAQRFGGDAVLVGRNEGGGQRWMWTLHGPSASESWSGGMEAGIHGAVDALARGEDASFALAEADALIAVEGITTLTDYATVGRLLDAIPGVRNVEVEEAFGTTVTFRVQARGGADGLAQQLDASGRLARIGTADGRLQYQYRR